MGLATVKRIVDEAGGTVAVETIPGHGTRMIVRLPQIENPEHLQADTQPSASTIEIRYAQTQAIENRNHRKSCHPAIKVRVYDRSHGSR